MNEMRSRKPLSTLVIIYLVVLAALVAMAPWGSLTMAEAEQYLIFDSHPAISERLQGYIDSGDPEQMLDYFFSDESKGFIGTTIASQNDLAIVVLTQYYAHILHDHPELAAPFMERVLAMPDATLSFFGASIVHSGATPQSTELVERWIDQNVELEEEIPLYRESFASMQFYCPESSADSVEEVHLLWGCYFASGQSDYLQRITEPLRHHSGEQGEMEERMATYAGRFENAEFGLDSPEFAAMIDLAKAYSSWYTLGCNARDYPHVKEGLKKIQPNLQGKVAENLAAILSIVE